VLGRAEWTVPRWGRLQHELALAHLLYKCDSGGVPQDAVILDSSATATALTSGALA